jgi:DNA-binding GntR family transcriptional regulator
MRLPQDEAAKAVGVSRAPIQEAIIVLKREGWVWRHNALPSAPCNLYQVVSAFHATVAEAALSPRITVVLRAMSALVPGPLFVLVPNPVGSKRNALRAKGTSTGRISTRKCSAFKLSVWSSSFRQRQAAS